VPLIGTGALLLTALGLFLLCWFQPTRLYRRPWILTFETSNFVLELLDDLTLLPDDLQQQDNEFALLFLRDFR